MPRAAASVFATSVATSVAVSFALLSAHVADVHAAGDMRAQWNTPQAPFALYGNTYYVGVRGLSSVLVTTPSGHVLIDGALPESAPRIAASIRELGFRIEDVKYILNSHAHFDHAGGIAELQRLSGATVLAAPIGAQALAAGSAPPEDPQFGDATPFAPVPNVRAMRDGEVLKFGGLDITMHATPGHTPGGASWTWRSCAGQRCASIAYVDSVTLVSAPGYRFSDHADVVAQFQRSAAMIETLPCDVMVSSHPEFSNLWERRANGTVEDPAACRRYAAHGRQFIADRLQQERN